MLNIDTTPLKEAASKTEMPTRYLAALSRSTVPTFNKVVAGNDRVTLQSIITVADALGLDVQVTYKKRKAEKAAA